MLEDAFGLLGNAVFRLNSWRQRRVSEYLTNLAKRSLKSDLPTQPDSSTPLAVERLTSFSTKLNKNSERSLDCSNNFRLPHTIYQSFISSTTKNYQSKIEEPTKTTSEYHRRTDGQTSDTRSDRQFERSIHLNPVCCLAKEQNKPNLQL